jgi:hypothetical protein
MKTYIVFAKVSELEFKPIKIRATGFYVDNDKRVVFQDGETMVGVFTLSELTGFVELGHIVNG